MFQVPGKNCILFFAVVSRPENTLGQKENGRPQKKKTFHSHIVTIHVPIKKKYMFFIFDQFIYVYFLLSTLRKKK